MRKKQNGGWKLSDMDWFYFSFYSPSCFFFLFIIRVVFFFMIRVDPSPILFYFYFFIRSELVGVDPSWSGPDWRSELIRSDFCTCLKLKELHYQCEMKILKKMLLSRQVVAYVYSVHYSSPEWSMIISPTSHIPNTLFR